MSARETGESDPDLDISIGDLDAETFLKLVGLWMRNNPYSFGLNGSSEEHQEDGGYPLFHKLAQLKQFEDKIGGAIDQYKQQLECRASCLGPPPMRLALPASSYTLNRMPNTWSEFLDLFVLEGDIKGLWSMSSMAFLSFSREDPRLHDMPRIFQLDVNFKGKQASMFFHFDHRVDPFASFPGMLEMRRDGVVCFGMRGCGRRASARFRGNNPWFDTFLRQTNDTPIEFERLSFYSMQERALARHDNVQLKFSRCHFLGGGIDYLQELATLRQQHGPAIGPAKLTLQENCLFEHDGPCWRRFLSLLPQKTSLTVKLTDMHRQGPLLRLPDIQSFEYIEDFDETGGRFDFLEALGNNRGPRQLSIHMEGFAEALERSFLGEDSSGFLRRLAANHHVTSLNISPLRRSRETVELAASLQQNRGLVNLRVKCEKRAIESGVVDLLFRSFTHHPSLAAFTLEVIHFADEMFMSQVCQDIALEGCKALVKDNTRITKIQLENFFDPSHKCQWDLQIEPLLCWNRFRGDLQKFRAAPAVLLPKGLSRFKGKKSEPSYLNMIWIVVRECKGKIAEHFGTLGNQQKRAGRKRGREEMYNDEQDGGDVDKEGED